ncbi:hypothetical protein EAG_01318, partial [Camponotus floridanus]
FRLSRARRSIENTFGILALRWRIYRKPINMHPKYVDTVVMATVCLHNFIKSEENLIEVGKRIYCPANFVDSENVTGNIIPGEWRRNVQGAFTDILPTSTHHSTIVAYQQRDKLANYFMAPPSEIPWQYEVV